MLLCHALDLSADSIQRGLQTAHLLGAEGLPAEGQQLAGVLILDGGACGIERSQLVACLLGAMHALEHGWDSGIFFAPEVVGDCMRAIDVSLKGQV